jgi:hypothetical protein
MNGSHTIRMGGERSNCHIGIVGDEAFDMVFQTPRVLLTAPRQRRFHILSESRDGMERGTIGRQEQTHEMLGNQLGRG